MTGRAVRLLSLGDVKAAGALLAASHGEYPAFRALAPDPAVRRRMLLQFQTAAVRDVVRNGRAYGAFAEGKLVGVALRQPPGRFPLSTARKLRMAPALLRSAAAAPSISAISPLTLHWPRIPERAGVVLPPTRIELTQPGFLAGSGGRRTTG